jgi:hypothetical protein
MTDERIVITDTETGEMVLDTAWPVIEVKDFTEVLMVADDQDLFDNGVITANDFTEMWGVDPSTGYLTTMKGA